MERDAGKDLEAEKNEARAKQLIKYLIRRQTWRRKKMTIQVRNLLLYWTLANTWQGYPLKILMHWVPYIERVRELPKNPNLFSIPKIHWQVRLLQVLVDYGHDDWSWLTWQGSLLYARRPVYTLVTHVDWSLSATSRPGRPVALLHIYLTWCVEPARFNFGLRFGGANLSRQVLVYVWFCGFKSKISFYIGNDLILAWILDSKLLGLGCRVLKRFRNSQRKY